MDKALLPFAWIIALSLLVSLVRCNDVYRSLCTPTIFQIRELIKYAFNKNIERQNFTLEFSSWTTELELRSFCRSNGFANDALPERIKVSKFPKMLSAIGDQVDILLTVKVPISRFYVDDDQQTGYRYWLMYKWPFEPFFCPVCRAFLTYSTEKNSSAENKFSFLYGMMQNRFPSIVNSENLETIRRENKKEFFTEEFKFEPLDEARLIEEQPEKRPEELPDRASARSGGKKERLDVLNEALNSTTTSAVTITGTTSSISELTTALVIDSNANKTISGAEKVKRTIYVNLSSFAQLDRHFLVGMNMLDSNGVFLGNRTDRNNRTGRSKREIGDRLSMRAEEFYLEYSLCYHIIANFYQPSVNCYPLFVDDRLKHANAEPLAIADCICWQPHAYKSLLFYQIILLFVIAALWLIFCNKFVKRSVLRRNLAAARHNYTQTPGQLIGDQSKIVVYQVVLQIHNPDDNACKLPGRLKVKLFGNLNEPFYELEFTSDSVCSRPFLFNEDILRTTSYIQSDTLLRNVNKLVVEFESLDERATSFLYLYGIVITNGFHSAFTFPYSNYLPHGTEVHLCERSVWQSYMARHENYVPLSDILPICNPRHIRISRIEKLMIYIIFVSKFATNPLRLNENEDVHWLFQFALEMIAGLLFYTLLFVFHVFYAKPSLNREFYFIKLHFEFLEFKFVRFFIFLIVANSLFTSTYDIKQSLWKNELTIANLRGYERTLLTNDLFWAGYFFASLVLFSVLAHFIEAYFYEVRKKANISPGPSNSLSDRLVSNNA